MFKKAGSMRTHYIFPILISLLLGSCKVRTETVRKLTFESYFYLVKQYNMDVHAEPSRPDFIGNGYFPVISAQEVLYFENQQSYIFTYFNSDFKMTLCSHDGSHEDFRGYYYLNPSDRQGKCANGYFSSSELTFSTYFDNTYYLQLDVAPNELGNDFNLRLLFIISNSIPDYAIGF